MCCEPCGEMSYDEIFELLVPKYCPPLRTALSFGASKGAGW